MRTANGHKYTRRELGDRMSGWTVGRNYGPLTSYPRPLMGGERRKTAACHSHLVAHSAFGSFAPFRTSSWWLTAKGRSSQRLFAVLHAFADFSDRARTLGNGVLDFDVGR